MTRDELEHLIRASADVTQEYEFVIVGSQSILGAVPNPEAAFTVSTEADIYPMNAPDKADLIDGALGEGSHFHVTYGYYAQGVGPETSVLPDGWISRVHRVQNANTNGRVGYCLDLADLFLSKAVAGRDKDRKFCVALMAHGHVGRDLALERSAQLPLPDGALRALRATIRRWAKAAGVE